MSLIKRLRNLWRLSEYEYEKSKTEIPVDTFTRSIGTTSKKAVIIKRKKVDPVEEFIQEND